MNGTDHPDRACTRRDFLNRASAGFGALAFAALLGERAYGARLVPQDGAAALPVRGLAGLHHPARAKQVIFLYMDGGVSQVDSFDPKPRLAREHGRPIGMKIPKTQFDDVGKVLKSPWEFKPRGQSGLEISDLFPHLAEHADRLCIVRSMTSKFSEHPGANFFLHTGHGLAGRPSMGAWFGYGLGSEAEALPGFVVLNGGLIPPGGLEALGSGFLPAAHQASLLKPGGELVPNVRRAEPTPADQQDKLAVVRALDRGLIDRLGEQDGIESAIANQELAFKMQSAVPELADVSGESDAVRRLYGLDAEFKGTRTYGMQCLLARRLIERGVRFVELTCPHVGHDRWDQHSNLVKGHGDNARAVDQPIAALLTDLAGLGLLDSTLVVFAGEFGRTPMAQGSDGRDHNPFGFSIWMAGGGVRGGMAHGATDDYGYYAVDGKLEIYDLHATMLHLMGIDHKRLTYRFSGRDMRLTDVHGEVVHCLLA